jgi:hypothetical protein
MLEAGATWVGGQQPFVAYGYYLEENDHAVGYLPADMVRSTFQDSEGWWSPVSTMNDGASGRRVVLGTDPAAVNAAVVALDRGELPEPERATAESVLAWLGPDQGNTWLRKSTWARLLLAQRVGLVVELAEPWAIAPEAVPGDLVAWLAARVLAGDYDHTDMVQQLRDAIEAHPREYGLYMILGQVYEQGDGPSGVELARLCYLEVSERGRWSELSPQAHAALERLDTVEE